ncbi:MAG: beta-ketoacyl-[acyl-carrier-protein] synthase family protein [Gammaproteobacteria bacterium]|nr:beta-ketoacyl-[acyl-carrier-protein] synthase family protein [Gammaproteobacteria bacterium]
MTTLILSHYTLTTAAGYGINENLTALQTGHSGLKHNDFLDGDLDTFIGRVNGIEKEKLPGHLTAYECRNNLLAYLAFQQDDFINAINSAKQQYGSNRIGVFLGTSTSGILESELIYQSENYKKSGFFPENFHFKERHNSFSISDFVRTYMQLEGPALVVSTACSSSAKVFATAYRYIQLGLCDAAIVGGVDSLCHTTLYGFNALELVSGKPCKPADKDRDGLSIGEAAAFILLEKKNTMRNSDSTVFLHGYGESSDAYHMSSPHPEGKGASLAMQQALNTSGLTAHEIDYINLHGTATPVNDRVEDAAINQVFKNKVKCSSTKGWTGHTLGAAGGVEAIYSTLSLEHNFMPQSLNTENIDPEIHQKVLLHSEHTKIKHVASNSFGFGGNNCCLIFSKC